MVDRLRLFLLRIDPGFDDFEHEEIIFRHHPRIGDDTFEIGETLRDQRRFDPRGGHWRETELCEFIDIAAGAIADRNDFFRQFHGGNGDDALLWSCAAPRNYSRLR